MGREDATPRAIPCDACRKIRVRCEWPEGGHECLRCLRLKSKPGRAPCSGPQWKSAAPCVKCAKMKLKCVWVDATTCERCAKGKSPCPGARDALLSNQKTKERRQLSASVLTVRDTSSEKLSNRVGRQFFDRRIAEEGLHHLRTIEYTMMEDAIALAHLSPSFEMTEIITTLYIITGLKFTTDPEILGRMDPSSLFGAYSNINMGDSATAVAQYGPRREKVLTDLYLQVWESLDRARQTTSPSPVCSPSRESSPISPTPSAESEEYLNVNSDDTAVNSEKMLWVSMIRLANRVCEIPEGLEEQMKAREHLSYATELAIDVKNSAGATPDQKRMMSYSAGQLARSEGFQSLEIGVPSLLSFDIYRQACSLSGNPILPDVNSGTVSVIFDDSSPRSALGFLAWKVLINPILDLAATLGRDLYANPSRLLSPRWYSTTWSVLDRILDHMDNIVRLIIHDERARFSIKAEDNAWLVLRSLFTAEQCFVQVGFLAFAVIQKHSAGNHTDIDLVVDSIVRAEKLFTRLSLRMAQIMCVPKGIPDVFYLLDIMVKNVDLLGDHRGLLYARLPPNDQQWILKGLRFASFWDTRAHHLVDALESSRLAVVRSEQNIWTQQDLATLGLATQIDLSLKSFEQLEKTSASLVADALKELQSQFLQM